MCGRLRSEKERLTRRVEESGLTQILNRQIHHNLRATHQLKFELKTLKSLYQLQAENVMSPSPPKRWQMERSVWDTLFTTKMRT
jgi:hypothetical protein